MKYHIAKGNILLLAAKLIFMFIFVLIKTTPSVDKACNITEILNQWIFMPLRDIINMFILKSLNFYLKKYIELTSIIKRQFLNFIINIFFFLSLL